ncbi:hypothetical protein GN244_ATG21010 [Phytophthora infestans]|uniref:Secreted RxLR effector peptide protein n=1 Tax=Phytophthora infestans TaxID=4787 RepID=A0A833SI09_PHYIN|nr:hypothetical protein GN244_ATG21010 [Phytophthora infestans]
MRVAHVLLAASVALVACNNGIALAVEDGTKGKSSATTTTGPDSLAATVLGGDGKDNNDIFAYKMPFKYNNISGAMVITIDKASLKKISGDMSSSEQSQVFDFSELEKNTPASEGEDRGLFAFAATHLAQYKLTQKAVGWFKSVF